MKDLVTLERLIVREIDMPLAEPFQTAGGLRTERRVLLIEAIDADGAASWSECVAFEDPGYLPETIVSARYIIARHIAPLLLGKALTPNDVKPLLDNFIRGNEMAKAVVEMAVWAIAAEKSGQSLAGYIGGTRESVPTGLAIGIQPDTETLVKRVEAAINSGYRRVKLKIAPGRDLEVAQAACEAVGGSRVMLDANCAYSLDDLPTFRAIDRLGLMMIEQPLAWDDIVSHAVLQRELQTPLCLDESLNGLARLKDMASLGSGRIASIKPGRVGGFSEAIAMHDYGVEHAIPVWCGGMLETGIGRAYNIALASLPGFTLPGDLSPSRRYWKNDIVTPPWDMSDDGMVKVPRSTPGLGVEVDTALVQRLEQQVEAIPR